MEKRQLLDVAKTNIKNKFIGLDQQIDQVFDKIRSWYLYPEFHQGPLVINLWGITGTGKTQLVRDICSELQIGLSEQDVRKVMDYHPSELIEINNVRSNKSDSICILFDEFQSIQTLNADGSINYEHNKKIVKLLQVITDGLVNEKLNATALNLEILEFVLTRIGKKQETSHRDILAHFNFNEEIHLTNFFNLDSSINSMSQIPSFFKTFSYFLTRVKSSQITNSKIDKPLIIVCGNLDQAYREIINTDLDILEPNEIIKIMSKITISDVKTALLSIFKPEQVARLGSNHILFPGISETNYDLATTKMLDQFKEKIIKINPIKISFQPSVAQYLKEHGIVASQGYRSLQSVFQSEIESKALDLIETKAQTISLSVDAKLNLVVSSEFNEIKYPLVNYRRTNEPHPEPKHTRVVTHELGHAFMYRNLFKKSPTSIRFKTSHQNMGGYVKTERAEIITKKVIIDQICVDLAGYLAEKMTYGEENIALGSNNDIAQATKKATELINSHAFGTNKSKVIKGGFQTLQDTLGEENEAQVELILKQCFATAEDILLKNKDSFNLLVETLKTKNSVSTTEFEQAYSSLKIV